MIEVAIPPEHRISPTEARAFLGCSERQLRLLAKRRQVSVFRLGSGHPAYDRRELKALLESAYRPAQTPVDRRTRASEKTASPTARPRRQTAGSR